MSDRRQESDEIAKAVRKLTEQNEYFESQLGDLTERLGRVTSALRDSNNHIAVADSRIVNPYLTPENPWADFMAVRDLSFVGDSASFLFSLADGFQTVAWAERPYLAFEARISRGQAEQILEVTCNGTQLFSSAPAAVDSWHSHKAVFEDRSLLQPGQNTIRFTHGGGATNPVHGIEISTTILHFQTLAIDAAQIAAAL